MLGVAGCAQPEPSPYEAMKSHPEEVIQELDGPVDTSEASRIFATTKYYRRLDGDWWWFDAGYVTQVDGQLVPAGAGASDYSYVLRAGIHTAEVCSYKRPVDQFPCRSLEFTAGPGGDYFLNFASNDLGEVSMDHAHEFYWIEDLNTGRIAGGHAPAQRRSFCKLGHFVSDNRTNAEKAGLVAIGLLALASGRGGWILSSERSPPSVGCKVDGDQ